MPQAPVSFAKDIAPILFRYRAQMAWRFDLANYDDVKANAEIIRGVLASDSGNPMPPPPYPPLPSDFADTFAAWIEGGYPA